MAHQCRQALSLPSGKRGFGHIADKFDSSDAYASACVRRFVEDTHVLGERTREQWQQEAFGQIDALLRPLSGPLSGPAFLFVWPPTPA